MYVIREVAELQAREGPPTWSRSSGAISTVLKEMGQEPLRVLTDVAGEPFWTIVAEAKVEKIDDFFAMEQSLMANESLRKAMVDYHELVDRGRREIYRVEGSRGPTSMRSAIDGPQNLLLMPTAADRAGTVYTHTCACPGPLVA